MAIIVSGLIWGILHAILDYTVGGIGILTAISTGVYLFILDRKKLQKSL